MKKWWIVIALLIVIGVLTGVYFLAANSLSDQNKGQEDGAPRIFDFTKDDIASVVIGEDQVTLDLSGGTAVLSAPQGYEADESAVNRLVSCLAQLSYTKELQSVDIRAYGIGKGAVKLTLKDNKSIEILLGDFSETKDGFFISVEDKVYKILPSDGEILSYGLNELRSKTILKNMGSVKSLEVFRGQEQFVKIEEDEAIVWRITSPIRCGADAPKISELIENLKQLSAVSFEEVSPEEAGLADPAQIIEIVDEKGSFPLRIGKNAGGGNYYAQIGKDGDVFIADLSSLGVLDMPLKDFTDSYVASFNISKVERVQEFIDNQLFDFAIDAGNSDKALDRFTLNGRDANQTNQDGDQLFRLHYLALISIRIDDILLAEPKDEELGKIEFSVAYKIKGSNTPLIYSYVAIGEDKLCVYMNEKYTGIIVDKQSLNALEGVRRTLSDLCEAVDKD